MAGSWVQFAEAAVVCSNPTPATNYKARNKRSGPCFSRVFAPIADLALFDETWRTKTNKTTNRNQRGASGELPEGGLFAKSHSAGQIRGRKFLGDGQAEFAGFQRAAIPEKAKAERITRWDSQPIVG